MRICCFYSIYVGVNLMSDDDFMSKVEVDEMKIFILDTIIQIDFEKDSHPAVSGERIDPRPSDYP